MIENRLIYDKSKNPNRLVKKRMEIRMIIFFSFRMIVFELILNIKNKNC